MQPVFRHADSFSAKYTDNNYTYNPNSIKTIIQSPPRPMTDPMIIKNKPQRNVVNIIGNGIPRLSQGSTTSNTSTSASPSNQNITNSQHNLSNSGSKQSVQISDILPALRQLQIRVVSLSQAVLHHEQILKNIPNKPSLSINSESQIKSISQLIHQQLQKRNKLQSPIRLFQKQTQQFNHNKIMNEISNIKQQILRQAKQRQYDKQFFIQKIKKQTQTQIMSMYEVNREVFRRIQIDMNELRQLIESSKQSDNNIQSALNLNKQLKQNRQSQNLLFSSNRKFSDPIMIRYRQVIDKVKLKPSLLFHNLRSQEQYQSQTLLEPAIINEVIYYLDKQLNLLDNQFNYLVDENGNNIKLQQKCISLLRSSNILQTQGINI